MSKRGRSKRLRKPSPYKRYTDFFSTGKVLIIGTVVLIAGLLGLGFFNSWQNRPVEIEGLEESIPEQGHLDTVSYPITVLPLAGGVHDPSWQNCGIYNSPIAAEFTLHSLEHGAVWIAYHPELPSEQINQLREITGAGSHRILAPYPNLQSPIVLTAWGYQLQVLDANDSRLRDFIHNYEKRGQAPEAGALCSGGIGQPIQ
jgi:hypothetical protein